MADKGKKIVVGLSGGVDSSVALLALKKQGYQPIGVSLRYQVFKGRENSCCSESAFAIAKEVCRRLKVPYYILDCRLDFEKKTVGYFLSLLKNKETPNPCLVCNRFVKFKKLFDFAKKQGASLVATGHYAQIKKDRRTGKYLLLRPRDKQKDQTYFLCLLTQSQLAKIVFPLGGYFKEQVYKMALEEGLEFFTKVKQSQDLCFVPQPFLADFLKEKIGVDPGEIVDQKGNVLGTHQGLHFYTIGQRKGMALPGGPWWVIGFDARKNRLVVTNNENDPALLAKEINVRDPHFIIGLPRQKTMDIEAKTRFNQPLFSAKLRLGNRPERKVKIITEEPQRAVASGQWAVFYTVPNNRKKGKRSEQICLGGGVIADKYDEKKFWS